MSNTEKSSSLLGKKVDGSAYLQRGSAIENEPEYKTDSKVSMLLFDVSG